jgi:hypothetical protein
MSEGVEAWIEEQCLIELMTIAGSWADSDWALRGAGGNQGLAAINAECESDLDFRNFTRKVGAVSLSGLPQV